MLAKTALLPLYSYLLGSSSLACWPFGSSPWLSLDSQYPPPASFVLTTHFRQTPGFYLWHLSWAWCRECSRALWSSACWSSPAPAQASQVTRQHAPGCRHCLGMRREWSPWLSIVWISSAAASNDILPSVGPEYVVPSFTCSFIG